MALNPQLSGKVYPALAYEVTSAAIKQYADATNEDNPVYFSVDAIAPPAFPIVPAGPAIRAVFQDPELQVNMARLVQAEEEHIFHRPIRAGDRLVVESKLAEVLAGDGGESFTIATTLSSGNGRAVEILSSMVIRGSGTRRPAPQSSPPLRELEPPQILFEASEDVDTDQTFRYADASGDRNEIHVDSDFARNSAGLPGIIVHGMCTMAFAARAVLKAAGQGDPLRLKRIKVQFSRPVFPGQTLRTRGWLIREQADTAVYGFETLNPRGQQVIKEGLAVISARAD